jgi:hypothetical protein
LGEQWSDLTARLSPKKLPWKEENGALSPSCPDTLDGKALSGIHQFDRSTNADPKDERRAVIQMVIQLDCIPAGMELFPASDDEQLAFIKHGRDF